MKTLVSSLKNLWRHKFMAVATILTISLVIMIFNILQAVNVTAQEYLNKIDQKIEFQVFLKQQTPVSTINQLQTLLKTNTQVTDIQLNTPNIALDKVNQYYPETIEILRSMQIQNPLPYSIKFKSTNLQTGQQIVNDIKNSNFKTYLISDRIKNKNQETISEVIERILNINKIINSITKLLIVSFLISSTIIIFTSIKTSLQNRRKELVIMKFMGANLKTIQAPYIVEGVIIGVLSTVIGMSLFFSIEKLTHINLNFSPHWSNLALQLAATTIIGLICSILTTTKHLKTLPIHIDE
ncbi:hypothetical protein HOH51_02230 [bacterium]|jgi:cell division transport system permease protein|nr:hypothetical protein [bacterium]